jgi:hypothetical protein
MYLVAGLLTGGDGYYTIPSGRGAMNNEPAGEKEKIKARYAIVTPDDAH